MAKTNTHDYTGPGSRWQVGDPTDKPRLDISRVNADYLHYALAQLMVDLDNPDKGLLCSIASPLHVEVAAGTVWSLGFWQAGSCTWWLLVREAKVASFGRGDADRYIPFGVIDDVPTS